MDGIDLSQRHGICYVQFPRCQHQLDVERHCLVEIARWQHRESLPSSDYILLHACFRTLDCFDTVCWVTGRAACRKFCSIYRQHFSCGRKQRGNQLKHVRLENGQGRIKASAGPGAVQNAGPLQAYNQLTTPTNCGPPKLGARVL